MRAKHSNLEREMIALIWKADQLIPSVVSTGL
jgi:hypothetical protein